MELTQTYPRPLCNEKYDILDGDNSQVRGGFEGDIFSNMK